jgi:hypothetical protein
MIKVCDLHWRKRRTPGDTLVGKIGDFWLMVVPRSGREIGKEDAVYDPVYATVFISAGSKPFEGSELPQENPASDGPRPENPPA